MKCTKCQGLMIAKTFLDHSAGFEAWKCINCGNIISKREKTLELDSFSIFYQQTKQKKKE